MTERIGLILLSVRTVQSAIEDVVSPDMDEACSPGGAESGNPAGRLRIDPAGTIAILFAAVDISGCSAVHDDIPCPERNCCNSCLCLLGIGEIDLDTSQSNDLCVRKGLPATNKRGPEAAIGTENDKLHVERLKAD
jgi:hypothetical protein